MKNRIKACKKTAHAIHAIGSRRAPVTPKSGSHVYHSICLSKLLYGVELMDVPHTIMREMESFHASIAKALQGLQENACNIGAIRTLGWTSIQSNIDINRLLFLWRIICLPVTCIYKRLLITRYGYICYDMYDCKGPLKCMLDTAKKYNLFNHVQEAIESGQHITMNA